MKDEIEPKSLDYIQRLELPSSDDLKQLQNDYYKRIIIENSKKVAARILFDAKKCASNGYSEIEISSWLYYIQKCRIDDDFEEIEDEVIKLLKNLNYDISYTDDDDIEESNIIISWR